MKREIKQIKKILGGNAGDFSCPGTALTVKERNDRSAWANFILTGGEKMKVDYYEEDPEPNESDWNIMLWATIGGAILLCIIIPLVWR